MDIEVVVAIISGVTGIVVGIIGLIQSNKATRLAIQAQSILETKKMDEENRRNAYQLAISEANPAEESLASIWQDIQALKEEIASILDGIGDRDKPIIDRLRSHSAKLDDDYGTMAIHLNEDSRLIAHEAKNHAYNLVLHFHHQFRRATKYLSISKDDENILWQTRINLGSCQVALSNQRSFMRQQQFTKLLGILQSQEQTTGKESNVPST